MGQSFRGFQYRTVSPKGIGELSGEPTTDPVGGTWSFFFGAEIEQPLYEDLLSGVLFIDTGTVTNSPGFDDYRISIGFGIRVAVAQLGPTPLAFDFGFPILTGPGDQEQIFSFSVDVPW